MECARRIKDAIGEEGVVFIEVEGEDMARRV